MNGKPKVSWWNRLRALVSESGLEPSIKARLDEQIKFAVEDFIYQMADEHQRAATAAALGIPVQQHAAAMSDADAEKLAEESAGRMRERLKSRSKNGAAGRSRNPLSALLIGPARDAD